MELTVDAAGISPERATAPAFLALELVVRNDSRREQIVFVAGPEPRRAVSVGAGETGRVSIAGLRPGRYRIEGGPGGRATLFVRREP